MGAQIADVLRTLAGGMTYEEINGQLHEVVEAVKETGKVGEISIKLRFKPNGENSVIVTDEVKSKVPTATRGETLFFTNAGGLFREDPRQSKLPLREVSAPADTEEREVH